jgi:hypothetical protein
MAIVYKAALELGKRNTSGEIVSPSLEQILEITTQWLSEEAKRQISEEDLLQERNQISLDAGRSIYTYFDEEEQERYFGFELKQDAQARETGGLMTVFAARVAPDKAAAQLTLVKELFGRNETMETVHSRISTPALVRALLEGVGAQDYLLPLSARPLRIPEAKAQQFVDFINNPKRKLPVIYASRTNSGGKVLINPVKTAERVCGMAHVLIPTDIDASLEIERAMTSENKCYNGFVQIYWPIVAEQMFNRYFTRDELNSRGVFAEYDFPTTVFGILSDFHVKSREVVTIDDIKQIAARRERKKLTDLRQFEGLAEAYADENALLRRAVQELGSRTSQLEQECDLLRGQLRENERESRAQERSAQERSSEKTIGRDSIRTVYDAVQLAQQVFSNRLVFLSRAERDAKKSNYSYPQSVFDALTALATTYIDSKKGIASVTDMNRLFMERCGFAYSSHQSETTMGAHKDEYRARLEDGRNILLEEHLKKGKGQNPRDCIRIAFYYDAQTQKVYVGFMGHHQTNTKS